VEAPALKSRLRPLRRPPLRRGSPAEPPPPTVAEATRFVVRGAELLNFFLDPASGTVHYKVLVQATEGRYWTVTKR